ncbi:CAP domain-containing protein [Aspergillus pseudoustus]|uniref:CAP domain-containing protein n=1 Tax=Aspergillus pseudoustus TaxID=1810923 RepID=A0ABR4KL48_9EURO
MRTYWRSSPTVYTLIFSSLFAPTSANETAIVTITAVRTATATATATATPKIPQDPSYTSASLLKSSVLSTTNDYRAQHNASALTWNDTLADYAGRWAEGCIWEHSHGPYGENLAYGYGNATSAVQAWGDEGEMYNFDKPTGFTKATGHFTQLVWRSTKEVGCAAVDCGLTDLDDEDKEGEQRAQGWYLVCEYIPGGNVVGGGDDENKYFRLNVLPAVDEDEDEDENHDDDDNTDNNEESENEDEYENKNGNEVKGEGEHAGQLGIEVKPGIWLWRDTGTGLELIGWRIGLWWVGIVVYISRSIS